jgi:hypothetical protein
MLIKNNKTHIAHGLKPSTKAMTIVIKGRDTFLGLIFPRSGILKLHLPVSKVFTFILLPSN